MTKQFIEDFHEKFSVNTINQVVRGNTYSIEILDFFDKYLKEVLKSLIDDESLSDESNGRYNREIELRKQIKKLYNINLNQNQNVNPTNRSHNPLDN